MQESQSYIMEKKGVIMGRISCLLLCCGVLLLFSGAQKRDKDSTRQTQPNKEHRIKVNFAKTAIPQGMRIEELNLDTLPNLKTLHKVASVYLGQYALFFMAIKMEESGTDNKESGLSRKYNNLTGMRFPQKRETYAIGSTQTRYAIYRNWFESMLDFKIYMDGMERAFVQSKGRGFDNEYEMLDYLYMYFNGFEKWRQDMLFLIRHVKKVYGKEKESEEEDLLIFDEGTIPF
jgi:hypothetical protein